jgi:hypothetical protein
MTPCKAEMGRAWSQLNHTLIYRSVQPPIRTGSPPAAPACLPSALRLQEINIHPGQRDIEHPLDDRRLPTLPARRPIEFSRSNPSTYARWGSNSNTWTAQGFRISPQVLYYHSIERDCLSSIPPVAVFASKFIPPVAAHSLSVMAGCTVATPRSSKAADRLTK